MAIPWSACAVLLMVASAIVHAQSDPWARAERKPGRISEISPALHEQAWFVPGGPDSKGRPALLKARVFQPEGAGPFKLVIISHGSPASASERPTMPVPRFGVQSAWFVARGYRVVLPMRRGYGDDSAWKEGYGDCDSPDYVAAGNASADDILAVTGYFLQDAMTSTGKVLLVGWSAGGFGSIAAAQRNPKGVFALINFAGGRGGHQGKNSDANCSPARLVKAMGSFSRGTIVPSLWIYARNDSFFAPGLSRRMADAYKAGGGRVDYRLLPDFGKEGHALFASKDGLPLWGPVLAGFLAPQE